MVCRAMQDEKPWEGGPWESIGRCTGQQQLGLEDKGGNDVVVNGRTSRGTKGGKGGVLKR